MHSRITRVAAKKFIVRIIRYLNNIVCTESRASYTVHYSRYSAVQWTMRKPREHVTSSIIYIYISYYTVSVAVILYIYTSYMYNAGRSPVRTNNTTSLYVRAYSFSVSEKTIFLHCLHYIDATDLPVSTKICTRVQIRKNVCCR